MTPLVLGDYDIQGVLGDDAPHTCALLADLACSLVELWRVVVAATQNLPCCLGGRVITKLSPTDAIAYWSCLCQKEPFPVYVIKNCLLH
jgi:hypothetical protein